MLGKFTEVKEAIRKTPFGEKTAYTAVIDGQFYGLGFSKDLVKDIPVGSTVEFMVTKKTQGDKTYTNLSAIAIANGSAAPSSSAPATQTAPVQTKPVYTGGDQYAALNRKLAVEVAASLVNTYYEHPSRKQQVALSERLAKVFAYADMITTYIATGEAVVKEEVKTETETEDVPY